MRRKLVLLLALCLAACGREPRNFEEASIADLHDAMQRGELRAEELVHWYLDRIEALDRSGPELRSLIEVNPDALTIAGALDDEAPVRAARSVARHSRRASRTTSTRPTACTTTAGSLALDGARAAAGCLRGGAAARRGRGDPGQDQPQRVGQLPLLPFHQRLEQPRRPDPQPLRPRPQSLRLQLAAPARRSPPTCAPSPSAPRRTARSSARRGANGDRRHQADGRPGQPRRHHPDRPQPGHRRPHGAHRFADAAILLSAMAGADRGDPATAAAPDDRIDYAAALERDGLAGARIGVVRGPSASTPDPTSWRCSTPASN